MPSAANPGSLYSVLLISAEKASDRFWVFFASISRVHRSGVEFLGELSPASMAIFGCALGLVAVSGAIQWFTPLFEGDEKMYHASRVLYWLQHQTVFPYITHNDRQNVFTFGSELFFSGQWF